jgi:hypothetical protein
MYIYISIDYCYEFIGVFILVTPILKLLGEF